jgi:redox-sensitive bicupin YhaK (pirin superfamily)
MDGMEAALPKISESKFNFDEIEKTDINLLHTQGILYLKMNYEPNRGSFIKLPINLINTLKNIDPQIKADEPANLIIRQNEKIKYLIINGFLKDLTAKNNPVHNGLVID